MKKILSIALSLFLVLTMGFSYGCANQEEQTEQNANGTVKVKYFQDAQTMLPLLKQGTLSIGLLPEPAATKLEKMTGKQWHRLSMQELYGQEKSYPQAVMLVKESLLSTYPNLVDNMQQAFGMAWSETSEGITNAVGAVNGVLKEGLTPSLDASSINKQVVDNCNVFWQSATDAKQSVKDYLNDIITIDAQSAKAVQDDYFYDGTASGTFDKQTITVVAPDGAPALAIAKYVMEGQTFGTQLAVNYSVVSANQIGAAVTQGTGDVVIIPVNASSKLYSANANDKYKMVSVVTHGNLYIMSAQPIITLADKTVGVIGQGLVPDLTFKSVLKKHGMGTVLAV